MYKDRIKKQRKIFLLFIAILITGTILVIETYAWFIGTSTVQTNEFNITVSSTIGLELSIDADPNHWQANSITINPATIESVFSNNNNKVPTEGLIPLSSNGLIDSTGSGLAFYEKTSLSASYGGYRLISNRINNTMANELDGYFVFDLYIRNGTGQTYNSEFNEGGAEDVYLTPESNAVSVANGNAATTHGVANSLRVGFFEIGRIKADGYSAATARSITCAGGTGITSVCPTTQNLDSRRTYTWNIWEPNHDVHTSELVNYFNRICKKRNNSDGTYTTTACDTLTTTSNVPTYAINSAVGASDNVDIYDGINERTSPKLTQMVTYKTSDATNLTSSKPTLIRLAGNSITKVRVYIWLEGQDVDNYDLISNDASVRINFGLTKDKFVLSNS